MSKFSVIPLGTNVRIILLAKPLNATTGFAQWMYSVQDAALGSTDIQKVLVTSAANQTKPEKLQAFFS